MPLFLFIFCILRYTYIHLITFIQYIYPSPFAEVYLHIFIAGQLSGKTSLWCRAENRTRACLTARRRSTNWATPHHAEQRRTIWATPHHAEQRRTITEQRRTILRNAAPCWATPHHAEQRRTILSNVAGRSVWACRSYGRGPQLIPLGGLCGPVGHLVRDHNWFLWEVCVGLSVIWSGTTTDSSGRSVWGWRSSGQGTQLIALGGLCRVIWSETTTDSSGRSVWGWRSSGQRPQLISLGGLCGTDGHLVRDHNWFLWEVCEGLTVIWPALTNSSDRVSILSSYCRYSLCDKERNFVTVLTLSKAEKVSKE